VIVLLGVNSMTSSSASTKWTRRQRNDRRPGKGGVRFSGLVNFPRIIGRWSLAFQALNVLTFSLFASREGRYEPSVFLFGSFFFPVCSFFFFLSFPVFRREIFAGTSLL
jgi:hypothetical protein